MSSSAETPLKCSAVNIAPDSSGGMVSLIHPCISSAAWVRVNDWCSNNCLSRFDQILGSGKFVILAVL